MNDTDLDALLSTPLPERDAGEFTVLLMEKIAHDQARPARILSWITVGLLTVIVAAACLYGAQMMNHAASFNFAIPSLLTLLTLALSVAVMQSAREG
ncbi:MAG: hypothetical protein ISS15_13690 [Alphaproteobacteria bacterium]|nr:hypothetical protein [Alphaproteobacteria bacterium]MBL6936243.1 hypothetical protein [Alphaproteobacteria bacterium]MBL7098706.1 hypothetical protein [Alphaproteobacteria bacterium]